MIPAATTIGIDTTWEVALDVQVGRDRNESSRRLGEHCWATGSGCHKHDDVMGNAAVAEILYELGGPGATDGFVSRDQTSV
jgi:hypothetical protein